MNKKILLSCLLVVVNLNLYSMLPTNDFKLPERIFNEKKNPDINPETFVDEIQELIVQAKKKIDPLLNSYKQFSSDVRKKISLLEERILIAEALLIEVTKPEASIYTNLWKPIAKSFNCIMEMLYIIENKLDMYTKLKQKECYKLMDKIIQGLRNENDQEKQLFIKNIYTNIFFPLWIDQSTKELEKEVRNKISSWLSDLETIKELLNNPEKPNSKKTYNKVTFLLSGLQTATKNL